jgi:hypothetical protein
MGLKGVYQMNKYTIVFTVISAVVLIAIFVYASTVNAEAPTEKVTEAETECKVLQCTTMYDVPISDDLQFFIQEWCKDYGIDPKLVLAVIKVESNFRPYAYNPDSDCCGLMQISNVNLPMLSAELGVTDLFNVYENAMGGIYLLRQALNYDGDIEHALLIYNNGLGGAKKLFYKGIHSTEYSRKVLAVRDSLTVREKIYEEK